MGDVQGCDDELATLGERAARTFGADHEIWLVGDLVNRGPSSLRVLERVRCWVDDGRARVVLGNHDIGLIRTALGLRTPRPTDTLDEVLASRECADWVEWLRRRPLAIVDRLGRVPFAMVHAGVAPDWSLDELARRARAVETRLAAESLDSVHAFLAGGRPFEPTRDDLECLTQIRSVDAATGTGWGREEPAGARIAWHRVWRTHAHAYGLVYGHWSMQGLHAVPGLRGVDTGCVHHGRGRDGFLTAWVPEPGDDRPFDVPDERFWKVPARRAYYRELLGEA